MEINRGRYCIQLGAGKNWHPQKVAEAPKANQAARGSFGGHYRGDGGYEEYCYPIPNY